MEQEAEEDPIVLVRRQAIEETVKRFPSLGRFSPEQYGMEPRTMGSVYVPEFKTHVKFTNLKGKHFKRFFRAFWMREVAQASRDGRPLDTEKIIGYGEYLLANINGWVANMYNRTGMEALRASPVPPRKLSWREKRAMRKQGGW